MKKNPLIIGIIIFIAIIFSSLYIQNTDEEQPSPQVSGQSTHPQETATVTQVKDGDTITLSDGRTIRYIGINTPEKGQPYGDQATKENRRLVLGKEVSLEFDEEKQDMYDRTLAYVYVDDVFVNHHLVNRGLALTETVPPNEKYEPQFLEAEADAKTNCRGLWEGLCEGVGEDSVSCIIIADIHADAEGNDNTNKNGEWITINNRCNHSISLTNFLLKDRSASNAYTFPDIKLSGQTNLTLHSGCGTDTNTQLFWQCPEKRSSIWNNDTDHAYLYNDADKLIAEFGY